MLQVAQLFVVKLALQVLQVLLDDPEEQAELEELAVMLLNLKYLVVLVLM
jgi:hypothetical protein